MFGASLLECAPYPLLKLFLKKRARRLNLPLTVSIAITLVQDDILWAWTWLWPQRIAGEGLLIHGQHSGTGNRFLEALKWLTWICKQIFFNQFLKPQILFWTLNPINPVDILKMDSTFLCGLGIQRQLENSQAEEMEETGRCCADRSCFRKCLIFEVNTKHKIILLPFVFSKEHLIFKKKILSLNGRTI